ncbi:MAG TPA: hypothetical protein VLJ10_00685 [Candidatus Bathyarchaeia archaeon]|nr:hypothetical protein [Candidatus Bathyarchaeia archaeon]
MLKRLLILIVCSLLGVASCLFAASTGFARNETRFIHQALDRFIGDVLDSNREANDAELQRLIQPLLTKDGQARFHYARVTEMIDYILFLNSRIDFVSQNNFLLKNFIEAHLDKKSDGAAQLARIRGEGQNICSLRKLPKEYRQNDIDSPEAIYDVLKGLEAVLITRFKKLQSVNDDLRALKMKVLADMKLRDGIAQIQIDQQIGELDQRLQEKDALIKRQNTELSTMRSEFDQMKLGLDVFRDRLRSMNQKVDELVKSVAKATMDAYEKEAALADRQERAQMLEEELNETKERLQLVQHIIQEKDTHIQDLEQQVLAIQSDMSDAGPIQSITQLRQEMTTMALDLRQQISNGQQKVAQLEKKFRDVALANAQLESERMKQEVIITVLEKQVVQRDELISDMEYNVRLKHEKFSQMKDIVKIYQFKLKEIKDLLREREKEVIELKKELSCRLPDPDLSSENAIDLGGPLFLSQDRIQQLKSTQILNNLNEFSLEP